MGHTRATAVEPVVVTGLYSEGESSLYLREGTLYAAI